LSLVYSRLFPVNSWSDEATNWAIRVALAVQ
jgi:hypothetical protein